MNATSMPMESDPDMIARAPKKMINVRSRPARSVFVALKAKSNFCMRASALIRSTKWFAQIAWRLSPMTSALTLAIPRSVSMK
jgi:hypothetical protein